LAEANRMTQGEIRSKTLIETNVRPLVRHRQLRQELDDIANPPKPTFWLLDEDGESQPLSEDEERDLVRERLAARKIST
jgi:hypothetical protein